MVLRPFYVYYYYLLYSLDNTTTFSTHSIILLPPPLNGTQRGETALDVADKTDPSGNVILVLTGWRGGPDQYDNIPEAQRLRLPGAPPRPQTGGVTFSRFYRRNNNQIV